MAGVLVFDVEAAGRGGAELAAKVTVGLFASSCSVFPSSSISVAESSAWSWGWEEYEKNMVNKDPREEPSVLKQCGDNLPCSTRHLKSKYDFVW